MKKNISMGRYILYLSVIVLALCGLTFLLSSCTEETTMNHTSDKLRIIKKIAVNFSLGDVKYNGNEAINGGGRDVNPAMAVVPLRDDLCLVATMEVDQPVEARIATSNLADGSLLRIVAYEDGTTYHTHADYKVVGGVLTSASPFLVAEGNYRFVAYSYNSTTVLPAHDDYTLTGIDPSTDLLWGCYPATGSHQITASSHEEVPITMVHKLSRVTIQATTEEIGSAYPIAGINTVSIPGKEVNLSINDGKLTAGSDVTQHFSSIWSGLGTIMVVSEPRIVCTNGTDVFQVNIGSLTISGYPPFTNLAAIFNKKLQGGVSYTIKICFKRVMFDVSPADLIFAFDANGSSSGQYVTITTNQPAWTTGIVYHDGSGWLNVPSSGAGSMMMVYPTSTNSGTADRKATITVSAGGQTKTVTVTQRYFMTVGQTGSSGERIYIDNNNGDPKLLLTKDPTNNGAMFQFGSILGWSFKTSGSVANADYNPTTLSGNWNGSWTYAAGQNNLVTHTLANLRAGKGDPCRLVGYTTQEIKDAISTSNPHAYAPDNKTWRLPDGNELDGFFTSNDGWKTSNGVNGSSCGTGSNKAFMPAVGYIDAGGAFKAGEGFYWSSAQKDPNVTGSPVAGNAHHLWLRSAGIIYYSDPQSWGMSIRCMRQ